MKLNMCGYEVEIKAKREWENRFSKEQTLYLLNHISLALQNAGELHNCQSDIDEGIEIYEFIKNTGFYEN